jgi:hypothetical protein
VLAPEFCTDLCNATFTPLLITSTSPIANTPGSDCLINTKRLGSIGTGAILEKIRRLLLHEPSTAKQK